VTTAGGPVGEEATRNQRIEFPLPWFGVLQLGGFHEATGGVLGAMMQTRLLGNRNASCVPSHSQRHEVGRDPGRRSGDGEAKGLLLVEMACCRRLRVAGDEIAHVSGRWELPWSGLGYLRAAGGLSEHLRRGSSSPIAVLTNHDLYGSFELTAEPKGFRNGSFHTQSPTNATVDSDHKKSLPRDPFGVGPTRR
jgi:hypothetical protein